MNTVLASYKNFALQKPSTCHENCPVNRRSFLMRCRLGHMSINQASIHYNLPYSSLYGRIRRGTKYENDHHVEHDEDSSSGNTDLHNSYNHSMMHQHHEVKLEPQTINQQNQFQHHHQHQQQQQHQQHHVQQSPLQPQIMLLQYQHAPTTHIQMYQPVAPS